MDRKRYVLESPVGPRVRINGREYDYFCGTSYYCLHGDPRVIKAACDAVRQYGLGPATSWDVPPLTEVEFLAAKFFDTPFAHYIPTAYLGVFCLAIALSKEYDIIFVDERSHYSVFDGIRSTGKPIVTFKHLDPDDLGKKLRAHLKGRGVPFVVTDGVFPMTGHMAPLSEYHRLLTQYDRYILCIDDSHGVGVLGEHGRGSCEYHKVSGRGIYFVGTMSKAFGGFGGIIPGDEELMNKLLSNVFVTLGASPVPIPAAAASAAGIKILMQHPELREKLQYNVIYLRKKLKHIGIDVGNSPVPIIAIHSLPSVDMAKVQQALEKKGIMVRYVPPRGYSDAPDAGTLKITVFAQHEAEQLDRLVDAMSEVL